MCDLAAFFCESPAFTATVCLAHAIMLSTYLQQEGHTGLHTGEMPACRPVMAMATREGYISLGCLPACWCLSALHVRLVTAHGQHHHPGSRFCQRVPHISNNSWRGLGRSIPGNVWEDGSTACLVLDVLLACAASAQPVGCTVIWGQLSLPPSAASRHMPPPSPQEPARACKAPTRGRHVRADAARACILGQS